MDRNNKNFEKTLNIGKKTLNVHASLELRTAYFTSKLQSSDLYKKSIEKNAESKIKTYISEMPIQLDVKLTNNDLLGHILKDIIIRYSLKSGQVAETKLLFSYNNNVPHNSKEYKSMSDVIKQEITTLNKSGSIIDFSRIYKTTDHPEFAQKMLDLFYDLYKQGKIYNVDSPIRCCTKCKNPVESKNKVNFSHYHILFRVEEDPDYILAEYNNLRNTFIVASTIRPWSLVGVSNLAIQKDEEFSVVEAKSNYGVTTHYIIPSKYVEDYMASALIFEYKIKKRFFGNMLKNIVCSNPLDYSKNVNCINTDIDLSEINTSILTITPAHSYLEYLIYKENNLVDIRNFVDRDGKITAASEEYKFKDFKEAELEIIENLRKADMLLYIDREKINVPKCANCGQELVYRYISEWYIKESDNELIENDIKSILKKASIHVNMPEKKPKFFKISKNTNRGVIIPVITCGLCNKKIINDTVIDQYKLNIEKHGSEKVLEMTPEKLLDGRVVCECGGIFFFKNENLFNEKFEILSSDITNIDDKYEQNQNIFLSNIDDFIKCLQINRYSDEFNERMKKIDKFFIYGNIIKNSKVLAVPEFYLKEDINNLKYDKESIVTNIDIDDIINKYGPDILRLWALHKSKNKKILIDENNVKYEERIYTNMRKTLSFIISNILDFDYDKNYVDAKERTELDKYIYVKYNHLRLKLIECYNEFDFYKAYILIKDFCMETLCDEYFNSIKYNLYILGKDNKIRRAAQSMLFDIFNMLNIYLGPIIPYLFIECYSYLENKSLQNERKINEENTYDFSEEYIKWQKIFKLKRKINKYISKAQNEKIIGDTSQASITVKCSKEDRDYITENLNDVIKALNVCEITLEPASKFNVTVQKTEEQRCERCHLYKNDVGRHVKYRYLCLDCANMIENGEV